MHPEKHARFIELYDEHYSKIFNYIFRRLGDFDDSKDLSSEVFLKAFRAYPGFVKKGVPEINWFYRIATNEIKLFYRSKSYRPILVSSIFDEQIDYSRRDLEEEKAIAESILLRNKQFGHVVGQIRTLPIKYQEVLTLKYFEGMDDQEISLILNRKPGTIRSLLSRALERLRKMQQV